MIRELKIGEDFYFRYSPKTPNKGLLRKDKYKIFVNDKKYLHNDVGPSYMVKRKYNSSIQFWYWNGYKVT